MVFWSFSEAVGHITEVEDIEEKMEEAALPFTLVLDGGCATITTAAGSLYLEVIASEDGIMHRSELGEIEYVGVK